MEKCPVQGCGRQFDNQQTMLEHVRRRHSQFFQQTKSNVNKEVIENQHKIQEELSKLPKVNRIIQMSKQKKPIQLHKRSTSKNRKQLSTLINNQSKVSQIINQSRHLVQDNSKKILKRPSLSKKQSNSQIKQDKLPALNTNKIIKKSKLEIIKSQMQKTNLLTNQASKQLIIKKSSQVSQQFYSTAPHFAKKLSNKPIRSTIKSKSKRKQSVHLSTQKAQQSQLQKIQTLKEISTKPQQPQKKKLGQRPLKRLLDRKKLQSSQLKLQNHTQREPLSESLYVQSDQKRGSQVDIKPALSFKQQKSRNRMTTSQFSDQKININGLAEWQQRTVSLRNLQIKKLTVPTNSRVQFLFANNCNIQEVQLNQIQTLVQLSLTNNLIQELAFLDYCQNYNLVNIFLDHNQISSLEGLPYHIKKVSLSFNKIKNLHQVSKILYKCKQLEELDLSFNPIRKQPNYKLAVIAACKNLKKLDGMKITKFDKQLASDFRKILDQQNQIIPLGNSFYKQQKWRPSTAVSIQYQQELQPSQLSQKQLSDQIKKLQRIVKQTKQHYQIIKQQNQVLNQEVEQIRRKYETRQVQNVDALYKKLQAECQELQMLNFLQYADEEELQALLLKKMGEYGVQTF